MCTNLCVNVCVRVLMTSLKFLVKFTYVRVCTWRRVGTIAGASRILGIWAQRAPCLRRCHWSPDIWAQGKVPKVCVCAEKGARRLT